MKSKIVKFYADWEGIMKKYISILIAMSVFLQLTCVYAKEPAVKIYVSQDADAGGDGSLDRSA